MPCKLNKQYTYTVYVILEHIVFVIYWMNIMSRVWSNSLLLNHVTIKRRGCLLVIYTATLVNGIKMFNLYLRQAMNCYIIAKRLGLKKVSKYIHVFKYPLGHIYLKNTQHIIHTFSISFVFSFIVPYIHDSIYTLFIANLFWTLQLTL